MGGPLPGIIFFLYYWDLNHGTLELKASCVLPMSYANTTWTLNSYVKHGCQQGGKGWRGVGCPLVCKSPRLNYLKTKLLKKLQKILTGNTNELNIVMTPLEKFLHTPMLSSTFCISIVTTDIVHSCFIILFRKFFFQITGIFKCHSFYVLRLNF